MYLKLDKLFLAFLVFFVKILLLDVVVACPSLYYGYFGMSSKTSKIKEFNLTKLFPSIVTMTGICVGVSSIRYALDEKWEMSIAMLLVATLIDAIDGKVARALNATSTFGAHLDSLSDFVNFGFVPAFLVYLWNTHDIARFGWAAVLFFTVCCAIRLARFNTDLEEDDDPAEWKSRFFKGVPSPAGALFCVGPMIISFSAGSLPVSEAFLSMFYNPYFLMVYTSAVALLMASKIPTYSLKNVFVKRGYASLFLIFAAASIIFAMIEPWLTVLFVGVVYIALIPFSTIHYIRLSGDE